MRVPKIGFVLVFAMASAACSDGSADFGGEPDSAEPVGEIQEALEEPGAAGPFAVTTEDYGSFTLGTSGFVSPFNFVEFLGRVSYPTNLGTGKYPLVLILHGNHPTCYTSAGVTSFASPCPSGSTPLPNYKGYDYVARALASYGMIVASVSANGINGSEGNTNAITQRIQVLRNHYNFWAQANSGNQTSFDRKFIDRVDFSRVAEIGHSRGGQAVLNHAITNPLPNVKAMLAIAPTGQGLSTPLQHIPFGILLGYCDHDVEGLQNVGYVDQARYVNPADEAPKYTFLALGGNHNYFNSYWTPRSAGGDFDPGSKDDWTSVSTAEAGDVHCGTNGKRLSAANQQYVGRSYITAFMRKYLLGATQFDGLLKGDEALPTAVTNGNVYVGFLPGVADRKEINRFDSSGSLLGNFMNAPVLCDDVRCDQSPHTLQASACSGSACRTSGMAREGSFGNLNAAKLSWARTGGKISQGMPNGDFDVTNFRTLQFRVAQPPLPRDQTPSGEPATNFSIQLRDRNDVFSIVTASSYLNELYYPPGNFGAAAASNKAIIMNTARVPLSAFGAVDRKHIKSVEFLMGRTPVGNILISDMAFVDPVINGYGAGYTGKSTYGANTGSAHGTCNWTSSGQICALPSTKTIHWCWDPATTTLQRGRITHFVPVLAARVGMPSDIVPGLDIGFKFVAHASCNDAGVQLVVNAAACSGTDSSRMSGYVCASFPAVTSSNRLGVINQRTQTQPPGNYYNWGLQNGRITLSLDLLDMDRITTSVAGIPDRDALLASATYHGLSWVIGLGARDDIDNVYTSQAVRPYYKNGWHPTEVCRARSFTRSPDASTFAIGTFCGPDPS